MAKPFRLSPPIPKEQIEQEALFQWAKAMERTDPRLRLLNSSQNGMRASSLYQAVAAKKAGMKKGFPDVSLPVPSGCWHGLFIEMKRAGGVPSDVSAEQREWLAMLEAHGNKTAVAFGWEMAKKIILEYLQ